MEERSGTSSSSADFNISIGSSANFDLARRLTCASVAGLRPPVQCACAFLNYQVSILVPAKNVTRLPRPPVRMPRPPTANHDHRRAPRAASHRGAPAGSAYAKRKQRPALRTCSARVGISQRGILPQPPRSAVIKAVEMKQRSKQRVRARKPARPGRWSFIPPIYRQPDKSADVPWNQPAQPTPARSRFDGGESAHRSERCRRAAAQGDRAAPTSLSATWRGAK